MFKTFFYTLALALGFCLFPSTSAFSQTVFAPPGATWRYNMYTLGVPPVGAKQYRYIATADTVIYGRNARILQGEIWTNGTFVPSPVMTRYVSVSGDKVYHLVDTIFELLYDFGAQQGDTIFSAVDGKFPFDNSNCNPPGTRIEFSYVIDSTGIVIIDGELLRTQHVRSLSYWSILGGLDGNSYHKIIERVGQNFIGTWFGCYPAILHKGHPATMRCYEDSTIFYEGYTAGVTCDSVVSTNSPERPVFSVDPDPFNAEIRLNIPENTGKDLIFNLLNINGAQVLRQTVTEGDNLIYPGDLPAGFYVWQISSKGNFIGAGKLIKINPR